MSSVTNLLKFEDWIESRDKDYYWVTVAQAMKIDEKGSRKDHFTISILADKCETKKLLKDNEWLAYCEFGNSEIWTDINGELRYNQNFSFEKDGIKIEPFIIHRDWYHRSLDSKFELVQDFILFYNLRWCPKNKVFKAFSEEGEEFEVVKVSESKDREQIEVSTKFLRNYLAVKNKILIRQHGHNRFSSEFLDKSREDIALKNGEYHVQITIANYDDLNPYKSLSVLLGKDIIMPYKDGKALLERRKGDFCKFIVGIDEEGNEVEETCDENKLSNRFVNRGTPFSLTPIFFKPEVLKKYRDKPSIFSVDPDLLSCPGLWHIPIALTGKDLVQVYLSDLGKIPFKEQQHWKQYNVVPDDKIPESRLRRDFMLEFTDSKDIMSKFIKTFNSFNDRSEKIFGFKLFLPLDHKDKYICNSLSIPVNDEQPEFEQQIMNIAKLLPDSINIKSLKEHLRKSGVSENDLENQYNKKIKSLEKFFQVKNLDCRDLVTALYLIQNIRSSSVAHRKGKKDKKVFARSDIKDKSLKNVFKKIINDLINSLNKIELK